MRRVHVAGQVAELMAGKSSPLRKTTDSGFESMGSLHTIRKTG